jgi:uncharacterized protein YndB with AHSA1/START domain
VPRNCVEATRRIEAPRDMVWDVVSDVTRWKDWGNYQVSELEREGDPPPGGVGAIRVTARKPVRVREEVEIWEPPSRMGYKLLSGLPVRDYHAVVTLSDAGHRATNLNWQSRFDAPLRGSDAVARFLTRKVLEDICKQVAVEAERRAHAAVGTSEPVR